MKNLLILVIVFIQLDAFAQQTAEFYADTNRLWIYSGHNVKTYKRVKEMRWKLNGKPLSFGSTPIHIVADASKFDTVLYKNNHKADWDTIICNVATSGKYHFVYNQCCNGFNVLDISTKKQTRARILFQLSSKTRGKYLGTIDDAAMLVTASADTLNPKCRSPLHPNIYRLTFKKIKKCRDTVGCSYSYCLVKKGQEDNSNLYYEPIETELDIQYMPLGDRLLTVKYDPKLDRLTLR